MKTPERRKRLSAKAKKLGARVSRSSIPGGIAHVTPPHGDVFADLGFSAPETEALKARSRLMSEAQRLTAGLTPRQTASLLGISLATARHFARGHIDRFTIDELWGMRAHAGVHMRLHLKKAPASFPPAGQFAAAL